MVDKNSLSDASINAAKADAKGPIVKTTSAPSASEGAQKLLSVFVGEETAHTVADKLANVRDYRLADSAKQWYESGVKLTAAAKEDIKTIKAALGNHCLTNCSSDSAPKHGIGEKVASAETRAPDIKR